VAKGRQAWYLSRTVLICPHCERAVKHPKKAEAWFLLLLPLLLAWIIEGTTDSVRISSLAYAVLTLLGLGGVVLFRVTTRLEKDNAI